MARKQWLVRRFRLGDEPSDDLSATTTAPERLAMVEELTAAGWKLSGQPVPSLHRKDLPIRIVRTIDSANRR